VINYKVRHITETETRWSSDWMVRRWGENIWRLFRRRKWTIV